MWAIQEIGGEIAQVTDSLHHMGVVLNLTPVTSPLSSSYRARTGVQNTMLTVNFRLLYIHIFRLCVPQGYVRILDCSLSQ